MTDSAPTPATPLADLIDGLSRPRRAGALLGAAVELPLIGPLAARIARAPMRFRFFTTRMTRLHAFLLRMSGGRLRRSWLFAAGQPVLSLTTTGRKTGLPRTTAVACFRCDSDLATAGMNLGSTRHPAWALNLKSQPRATIELAGRNIAVTARLATGDDHARLWKRWVELQPSALAFQRLAGREIPLFILERAPGE